MRSKIVCFTSIMETSFCGAPKSKKAICTGFLFTEKNPDTNGFHLFNFRDAPAILYREYQNHPLQNNTGHAQSNMVTDLYAHINNKDRQRLAVMVNESFFNPETQVFEADNKPADPEPETPAISPEIAQIVKMLQQNEGMAAAMMGMLKCMA